MRKLAHIEKIEWKKPIEGADRIELVGVLGWQCITQKDEFQVGDLCIYIEIDSIVDKDNPDFAFLAQRKYRIKTQKMRGVLSQGIVFKVDELIHKKRNFKIGEDLTKELKITEVEDKIPKIQIKNSITQFEKKHTRIANTRLFKWLKQFKWFKRLITTKKESMAFPKWIKKTDETRLQAVPQVLNIYKNVPMIVTEKVDGMSGTFGLKKEGKKTEYVVCSRNYKLQDNSQDAYHEISQMYDIENVLKDLMSKYNANTVILQGEIIGEEIQENKYKLKGHDIYCFNLIIDNNKINSIEAKEIMEQYNIKWVPILETDFILLDTVDEMIEKADGQSKLYDTLREGLVIRDNDNTTSFKCVSNKFLLKHSL